MHGPPIGPADLVPQRLAAELDRPALLERLAGRWQVPLTLVVAGAGFGKSTALAQAFRSDEIHPPGLQAWVRIEPGLEQGTALAEAIVSGFGRTRQSRDPLSDVLELAAGLAPVPLCLVVDDLHRLDPESSSLQLLCGLVRRLPAHLHLVLSSRTPPPVPTAALRAADRLVEVGEPELAFHAGETAALAGLLGRPPVEEDLGGWPALVRLALTQPAATAWQFTREEVLSALTPAQTSALHALALVGTGDASLITEILGEPVDLDRLADEVPLVGRVGRHDFRAHELWTEVVTHRSDRTEVVRLRRRAVDALATRGDLPRAGAVALAGQDWERLSEIAVRLVAATVLTHPADVSRGWLAAVPRSERHRPGLAVLAAASRWHRDHADREVDGLLDRAWAGLDEAGRCAALAVAVIAATGRHDTGRLAHLSRRGADDGPAVRMARTCAEATGWELAGDAERALEVLASEPADAMAGPERPAVTLAARIRLRCLLLAGRPGEAARVAEARLSRLGAEHLRHIPALCRWLTGSAEDFGSLRQVNEYARLSVDGSSLDRLVGAFIHTAIAASWGRVSPLAPQVLGRGPLPAGAGREAAMLTNARAGLAIAQHDEAAAGGWFASFVALYPPVRGPAERHLRRMLALGYVLNPGLRALWDAVPLSAEEEHCRSVARLMLAARDGTLQPDTAVPHERVFTTLPLPWSVELAAHLRRLEHPAAGALAGWLAERVGDPVRQELRRLRASGTGPSGGAGALQAEVPVPLAGAVRVNVLGPLQVTHGEEPVEATELSRIRVRELLSVLVVERQPTRDRLIDLLWPGLDREAGNQNLRVTLSHLRRLLEPQRSRSEACYLVRAAADRIWLHDSPSLQVDLWQARSLVEQARGAQQAGDPRTAASQLLGAVALWRGEPLPDLVRLEDLEPAVTAAAALRLGTVLQLGRLALTAGRPDEAARLAERAVALDEFNEEAHRLAMAAARARGDSASAKRAARRTLSRCRELGVSPAPATRLLLHRCLARPAEHAA